MGIGKESFLIETNYKQGLSYIPDFFLKEETEWKFSILDLGG